MKTKLLRFFGLLLLVTACPAVARSQDGGNRHHSSHLRFVEEADGSARLQTVILQMSGPENARVDLVGAVHVADAAYFAELNRRFKGYDAVLYELVGKPEEGNPLGNRAASASGGRLGWIGGLQKKMRDVLKLEGQLEKIDYTAANFVHADMDAETFQKSQDQNKETFLGLWLKALAAQPSISSQSASGDLGGMIALMQLLMKKDSADGLKRLIGREFGQMEGLMTGLESGGGTVIIGERNRVALEVMQQQLQAGRKRLAVFYGAGHFPDMQRRLEAMGFEKTGEEWLTAWDIPAAGEGQGKAGGKEK